MSLTIVGASLGDCVHVAGLVRFLSLAEDVGHETTFLGPAVPIADLISAIREVDPDLVAISYRLTPEAAGRLLAELQGALVEAGLENRRFVFGGTAPVCRVADRTGLFEAVFDGHALVDDVVAFLRGEDRTTDSQAEARDLVSRIEAKAPYPVIRHHFGLPSLEETVAGVREIALARVCDVISIGPDQNAQACLFRPGDMDPAQDGAGGVPVRTEDDFGSLASAAAAGNHPLLRSYSGTRDLLDMADLLVRAINNAWSAVPLCWYNVLDGRSRRPVAEAIAENQRVMAWHGERGIPVEVNEAHHWSLRDAHDTIAVVMAYLAAYNARAMGVRDYVAQFMFNTPPGTWITADIGKMLAKLDLISRLERTGFRVWRQTRAGLASYPADMEVARGQLATSVFTQMALSPHIVHVVSFSEADHAATAADVIESCKIARGVIDNCLRGMPDLSRDPAVEERRQELVAEADVLLAAIGNLGADGDPYTDPGTLARAIEIGLLDAPHLRGNPAAAGRLRTRLSDGRALAVDDDNRPLGEADRIARIVREI